MEQTERIKEMEQRMNRASMAVMGLSAALDQFEAAKNDIDTLNTYYGSSEWKEDFDADQQNLLPKDLKRGVLSEDGLWNLLEDYRELKKRLKEQVSTT
ncbi:MAG: DUF4298 domain-containing protein [Prevotella sp.]|jgi:hypothetical protein|nr:DUF4298 domain-containing protein [Prevotella sp.]